ncbi:MAG: DUF2254 domain-containing protein [Gammaproteobacteria bacterium]|nr:DUF2254 domain-containing protein [Gammaproteobacteria bacterium]MBT8150490.1 DUF2254 domain-containing protein [Gammaproteobacteria bacterium]NNM11397.1 DUF2254 domain-containing protein [Pseudomonadales bacterium]RZV54070.1 MAG: DUF2254 domain-containing protein [Pseudomonadales bacterium]
MWNRFIFFLNRVGERLWVRPLIACILSVAAAFVAKGADSLSAFKYIPAINSESIETLLSITASSMLVIATLAVASMVSAYASASSGATPRSFTVLVSDNISQNALSTFLGTFIFTFVALIALKNGFYGKNGLLALASMTAVILALVIITFLRWVDWIARLGRIGTTIKQVEAVGMDTFLKRRRCPRLGGALTESASGPGQAVYADTIGYVQHINVETLQSLAEEHMLQISICAIPGVFATTDRPIAQVWPDDSSKSLPELSCVAEAYEIGSDRTYDDDPRFALIALSEIASKALSPAVNDPGTAIGIFGSFIRLFSAWSKPLQEDEKVEVQFDRVHVPALCAEDMLDDAFSATARDGASIVEVQIRLQKALKSIAAMPDRELTEAAKEQSRLAVKRAKMAINFEEDLALVTAAAEWSLQN